MVFPGGSDAKESTCNAGDLDSVSGLGRSPGRGHGHPLQYFRLENSMDKEPDDLPFMWSQRFGHD